MVLILASLAGHLTSAPVPFVVGSLVSQPLLVAAAGLVVVLAILLVFVMVLRSGDNKRSSIGIGYDAQQGPIGQPKAPPSQPGAYGPRGNSAQGWPAGGGYPNNGYSNNGYGATAAPNSTGPGAGPSGAQGGGYGSGNDRGWAAGYQNPWSDQAPSSTPAYQASQNPGWGQSPSVPASGQGGQWADQGAWGQQQGGQPAMQGNWGAPPAQPSTQPSPQGSWGQPQAPGPSSNWSQQADQQAGWGPPAAPSQPSYGGGAPRGGWTGGVAQQAEAAPAYAQSGYGEVARPSVGRGDNQDRGAVLVVRQGNDVGRPYPVRKDRMTIGRSRDSDIFLEDLAVSRTHTTIGRDDRGRYVVRDENSANGTFVNNQRISGEQVLQDGDEIQIGTTVLAFSRR